MSERRCEKRRVEGRPTRARGRGDTALPSRSKGTGGDILHLISHRVSIALAAQKEIHPESSSLYQVLRLPNALVAFSNMLSDLSGGSLGTGPVGSCSTSAPESSLSSSAVRNDSALDRPGFSSSATPNEVSPCVRAEAAAPALLSRCEAMSVLTVAFHWRRGVLRRGRISVRPYILDGKSRLAHQLSLNPTPKSCSVDGS